jgi:hypothetical protein
MASRDILEVRSTTQQQPNILRIREAAAQQFQIGVPVMIDLTLGAVKEWDGTTYAAGIAGISKEPGANLPTVATPRVPGANLVTGQAVPNQPQAYVLPVGAPLNDGRTGVVTSTPSTVFLGQIGQSQTRAYTDLGAVFGMTKDTDGHWYVDKTKTGTSAVVRIEKFDFWDKRGVEFTFLPAAVQKMA